jgi:hypothetical protein
MRDPDLLRSVLATFVGEDDTFNDMIEELLGDNPTESVINAPGQRRTSKTATITKSFVALRTLRSTNGPT